MFCKGDGVAKDFFFWLWQLVDDFGVAFSSWCSGPISALGQGSLLFGMSGFDSA